MSLSDQGLRRRVQTINSLQVAAGAELINPAALLSQEVQARELVQMGILPTIGCEIEIKASTLMPAIFHDAFGEPDEYGRFKPRYFELPSDKRSAFS